MFSETFELYLDRNVMMSFYHRKYVPIEITLYSWMDLTFIVIGGNAESILMLLQHHLTWCNTIN